MNAQVGGLVLSSEVFQTAWFECLAAFVAFNTLIYVGLTLAKLLPWPRTVRPVEIRGWIERTFRRPAPPRRSRAAAVPPARKGGEGTVSRRLAAPATAVQPEQQRADHVPPGRPEAPASRPVPQEGVPRDGTRH